MKTVLAFDLGSKTGWCHLVRVGPHGHIEVGFGTETFSAYRSEGNPERLLRAEKVFDHLLRSYDPGLVVYERVDFVVSRDQISLYAQLSGLLLMQCYGRWEYVGCPVPTLKKFALPGQKKRGKEQMILAAEQWLLGDNVSSRFNGDNALSSHEADAIHLARYGLE